MNPTSPDAAASLVDALAPVAPPLAQLAHVVYAVALGVVVAAAAARSPQLRLLQLRRSRRRPVCSCCGHGRARGEPPLLIFRDTGPRCTECVRTGVGREPTDERSRVEELISRVAA